MERGEEGREPCNEFGIMKKIALLLGVCLASVMVSAQNVNPRGLFRWSKISYEGGRPDALPEIEQYKYCTDKSTLQLVVRRDVTVPQVDFQVSVLQNDAKPFNYTGDVPMGVDGKDIRVYDCDSKSFKLKWYNVIMPQAPQFPYKEFITEQYTKEGVDARVARCFELCKQNLKGNPKKNKLYGGWFRVGSFAKVGNIDLLMTCPNDMYKVYDEDVYFHAYNIGSSYQIRMYFVLRPVKYKGANVTEEFGTDCTITWVDDDTYKLSYKGEDGNTVTELWKRSGLPAYIQEKVFGTNFPEFKLNNPIKNMFR